MTNTWIQTRTYERNILIECMKQIYETVKFTVFNERTDIWMNEWMNDNNQ